MPGFPFKSKSWTADAHLGHLQAMPDTCYVRCFRSLIIFSISRFPCFLWPVRSEIRQRRHPLIHLFLLGSQHRIIVGAGNKIIRRRRFAFRRTPSCSAWSWVSRLLQRLRQHIQSVANPLRPDWLHSSSQCFCRPPHVLGSVQQVTFLLVLSKLLVSLGHPLPELFTLGVSQDGFNVRRQCRCPAIYRADDDLLGAPLLWVIGVAQQRNGLARLGVPVLSLVGLYPNLHEACLPYPLFFKMIKLLRCPAEAFSLLHQPDTVPFWHLAHEKPGNLRFLCR